MAKDRTTDFFRIAGFALAALMIAASPARSSSAGDAPDSYAEIEEDGLKQAYLEALAATEESSTGKLVHYHQGTGTQITVHAVQDRGLPSGEEYPTYVFRTVGGVDRPELIYKTLVGTRIYHSDSYSDTGCLFSAQKAYSDICLADVNGNAAPDLPGLRKDFWSDLIKLFGL
ncbi:hypothetical protein [Roseibium sp. M-1]